MSALNVNCKPKNVHAAHACIEDWDFTNEKKFLIEREGFEPNMVEEMSLEYKRFMALCATHATNSEPLPISTEVDPFWHTHLLFSESYVKMSKVLGSNYLHHQPASGDELVALEPGYRRTLSLYEQNFGKPNEKYWPEFSQICGGSACACSGTGNE